RGKVHYGIETVLREKLIEQLPVTDVALHEQSHRHGVPIPVGQIVQDGHLSATLKQILHVMRADITGAPGNQYVHYPCLSFTRLPGTTSCSGVPHASAAPRATATN